MARTRSNTKIILQENGAYDRPTFERLSADANIYPGLLLVLTSAGKVDGAGDAHDGPVRAQPPGHREASEAEAEDEDALAGELVHRSFSVDRPNSTSSIVMITMP